MAKKSKPITMAINERMQLRQWCIQMAMAWPSPQVSWSGQYQNDPFKHAADVMTKSNIDVIDRASKIFDWITTA